MDSVLRDIKYGIRNLLRSPGFTLAATTALGLGIGAVTAIFSVLDGVVLEPLPHREPQELVMLWETNLTRSLHHEPISPVNFVDYHGLKQALADSAAWWRPDFTLTDDSNEPVRVNAIEATSSFFAVLGAEPTIGRTFQTGELFTRAGLEIVISHRLWQSRFQSDPDVVGKSARLNGRPFLIIGVMPPGFDFPGDIDIWQHQTWDPASHVRTAHFMEAVARLGPGVSLERAQTELDALAGRLQQEYLESNREWSVNAVPLSHEVVGFFRPALFVLMAAVSLLLLIACINVANLLLARSAARSREAAIRSAMGATRERLLRQFLTESVLLALMGAVVGVLIATLGIRILVSASPIPIPRLAEISIDGRVLFFSVLVTFGTALVFGLLPAAMMSRADMQKTLKEAGRGSSGSSSRTRQLLVISEVGLAVMLLVGAGLLIRTVSGLIQERPGFDPQQTMVMALQAPAARYATPADVERFYGQLLGALRERSAIGSVGVGNIMPLSNGWRVPFLFPGESSASANEETVQYHSVSDGFFETIGARLVSGRLFDDRDTSENPGVVVVNESFVRRFLPDEDPVGKTLLSLAVNIGPLGSSLMANRRHRIVGVVGDVKNQSLRAPVEPSIYHTTRQFPFRSMNIVVRGARRGTEDLAGVVREVTRGIDPALALSDIRPVQFIVDREMEQPRFLMFLMSGFAALALVLASLGIYGVLAYSVAQRRQEISIRLALGASPSSVLRLVVREGLQLTVVGASIGIAGALVFGRYLASVLYGVALTDGWTLGSVVTLILGVAFLACILPARRAASTDPLAGLRSE